MVWRLVCVLIGGSGRVAEFVQVEIDFSVRIVVLLFVWWCVFDRMSYECTPGQTGLVGEPNKSVSKKKKQMKL